MRGARVEYGMTEAHCDKSGGTSRAIYAHWTAKGLNGTGKQSRLCAPGECESRNGMMVMIGRGYGTMKRQKKTALL